MARAGVDGDSGRTVDALRMPRRQLACPADSSWYFALTLGERAKLARHCGHFVAEVTPSGKRRLARWIATPAFAVDSNLGHFLECHGLTDARFLELLSTPPEFFGEQLDIEPDWMAEIVLSLSQHDVSFDDVIVESKPNGFLSVVDPFIAEYTGQLAQAIRALNDQFSDAIAEGPVLASLSDGLYDQLSSILARSLVLELNIARIGNALQGATPAERRGSFLSHLKEPSFRTSIFRQYPVLARHCVRVCRYWLNNSKEFLTRLCNDREALCAAFGCSELGPLMTACVGTNESHRGGRRIVSCTFANDLRVVYKPRPLTVEMHFQHFAQWLNARGQHPQLRTITILDRDIYGWSEHVNTESCKTIAEVELFYRRQGSLLAILYVLAGTDCHFENVIASGQHPVVVDGETLFQPRILDHDRIDSIGQRFLADSVMAVGMLPTPVCVDGQVVDLSGLGAMPFQVTPLETNAVEGVGTDEMKITRVAYRTSYAPNRPTLNDSHLDVQNYIAHIDSGFSQTYALIQSLRSKILTNGGPLSSLHKVPIRVLVRPTAAYTSLLEESLHPKALGDSIRHERILGQLWWATAFNPVLRRFVFDEYQQMLDGDVPYFSSTPNSFDVLSSTGGVIPSVFASSGFDVAKERMGRMGDRDLQIQRWLIRASVFSLGENRQASKSAQQPIDIGNSSSFLDAAVAIGERLDAMALRGRDGVSWLSFDPSIPSIQGKAALNYRIGEVGSDLYGGLAGIALFLSYVAFLTSHQQLIHLVDDILRSLETRLPQFRASCSLGAFDGLAGLVYLYTHLGKLRGDTSFYTKASSLLQDIEERVANDRTLDIIGGSAGCIPCLLSLYRESSNERSLELAVTCGDRLLTGLRASRSMQYRNNSSLRYARGFSHGYSGIAWALSELGNVTMEPRFLNATADILFHERELLSDGAWTAADDEHLADQATWCHGAPGIALARLAILRKTDDPEVRADAEVALERACHSFELDNHGLCHGQLGNLEVLLFANETLSGDRWGELFEERSNQILEDIKNSGWRSACPGNVETPGLMTGIAGIGYGLLRTVCPADVPSVLLLEAPR